MEKKIKYKPVGKELSKVPVHIHSKDIIAVLRNCDSIFISLLDIKIIQL